ncbi:hypothetical protein F5890DRAFT_1094494 [Lentinula detonsa]|uniref:Uncharacterized protein n=1 Tax=Lentinula detonsa TaxID=2804962 RepID=A0AA38UUR0_9AGAR|nr:hypothetical protein F5890DRAFT_1094494 [Lentinula detonsa]
MSSGRQWVLERIRQVLMVIATELSLGGGLIGACPVSTSLGKQVWNDLRRKLGTTSYTSNTDPEYGGPITFHRLRFDEPRNPARDLDGDIVSDSTVNNNNARSRTNTADLTAESLRTTFSVGAISSSATGTLSSNTNSEHSRWSLLSRRRRRQTLVLDEQTHWSERPRWIRIWFLTRPHLAGPSNMLQMLVPEYRSLVPAYTSFRGTLPQYLSDRSRSRG